MLFKRADTGRTQQTLRFEANFTGIKFSIASVWK